MLYRKKFCHNHIPHVRKPLISIFVEIRALRNFMHFGGHLKNDCQNDRHFEIALVTITFL